MKTLGIVLACIIAFFAVFAGMIVIGLRIDIPDGGLRTWWPPQRQTKTADRQSSGWKVAGRVPDGLLAPIFVELEGAAIKHRETYEDAVRSLCGQGLCRVMFFAPGDPLPEAASFKAFEESGGFDHRSLAVWSAKPDGSGDFVRWDCERAGPDSAPLEALCGEGVREAFNAVSALAERAGMQKACRWPPTSDDAKIAREYIARMTDRRRQEQFRSVFEELYNGGNRRPDNLNECGAVRKRTEQGVLTGRKLLRSK